MSNITYSVAVGDSTNMARTRRVPDFDCGHKHRTIAAAEACQSKLIGWDSKTRTCSAKWYNSYIIDSNGQ